MREEQEPVQQPDNSLGYKTFSHPAYGCVVLTNHSGMRRLFGSDLIHHNWVCLEFHAADYHRGNSNDGHYARETLLEVYISEAQWARIIASSGSGNGTPVTISERRDGKLVHVPAIAEPQSTKKELHGEEMADEIRGKLEEITKISASIKAMVDAPGTVSKKDLKKLQWDLDILLGNLPLNVKFVYDQFAEATEKLEESCKLEVEAHLNRFIHQTGLEHLRSQAPVQLTQSKPKAIEDHGGTTKADADIPGTGEDDRRG